MDSQDFGSCLGVPSGEVLALLVAPAGVVEPLRPPFEKTINDFVYTQQLGL